MGIKQTILKDQLPLKYQDYELIETKDGLTHSVYLLGSSYVLKIVEVDELDILLNEQKLLNNIFFLRVPKCTEIVQKKEYIFAFYTQINGESIYTPNTNHIKQIALFLKKFHSISQNIATSNSAIFTKGYLKSLILETKEKKLLKYFDSIECELNNDGIIHGDLFCDNVKFYENNLTGVYDFMQACSGDFRFELAVVALSWCFDNDSLNIHKVDVLLKNYEIEISLTLFKEYIKFALLYYITKRYLVKIEYKDLLFKMESL